MTYLNFNEHGPIYNIGGAQIERWRRVARGKGSLMNMKYEERCSYAEAVLDMVRRSQRSSLQRELPSHAPNCASGTWHTSGKAILKAVSEQNRQRFAGKPTTFQRNPDEVKRLYEKMMEEKRARQTVVLVVRQKPKRRKR